MGRKLRVDFSNEPGTEPEHDAHSRDTGSFAGNGYGQPAGATSQSSSLPPLPPGKELPPNVTATDAISRTLNTLPPSQLLDILTQMKALATNDPARATELLSQAPQLSYAVFQALLLMGLVSPDAIRSVVDGGIAAPPTQAPPVAYPQQAAPGFPPAPPAGVTNTPPVAAAPYGQPAPYAAPPPPAAASGDPNTDALVQQVLALPMDTINRLPEAERAQILALRAQFGR
jgi:cleavage stimulation factor subunit 2